MTNALIPFNFEDPEGVFSVVRGVTHGGRDLFVAKDLVDAVGAGWDGAKTVAHVPTTWKQYLSVPTNFGLREMVLLTEEGVYFYLQRSDKPKAKPIQLWIAGTVLPSLRKTGSYSIPTADPQPTDASSLTAQALVLIAQAQQLHAQRLSSAESKIATAEDKLSVVERKLSVWDAGKQDGTFLGPLAVCKLLAGNDDVAELLFYCRRSDHAYRALQEWLLTEARKDKVPSLVSRDGGSESYMHTSCYNRGWLSAAVTYYASNVFKA